MSDETTTMTLRDTIIPKSDQLNYDDVATAALTVRVTGLAAGTTEQPVIVRVVDDATGAKLRDYKPCKGMRRVLVGVWGDKGREWVGKRMTLVGNPAVMFGGVRVGGIEISHVSGIDAPLQIMLATSKSKRKEYTVKPLKAEGGAA